MWLFWQSTNQYVVARSISRQILKQRICELLWIKRLPNMAGNQVPISGVGGERSFLDESSIAM